MEGEGGAAVGGVCGMNEQKMVGACLSVAGFVMALSNLWMMVSGRETLFPPITALCVWVGIYLMYKKSEE